MAVELFDSVVGEEEHPTSSVTNAIQITLATIRCPFGFRLTYAAQARQLLEPPVFPIAIPQLLESFHRCILEGLHSIQSVRTNVTFNATRYPLIFPSVTTRL